MSRASSEPEFTKDQTSNELKAMQVLAEALDGLDGDARGRVLRYMVSRYKVGVTTLYPDVYANLR